MKVDTMGHIDTGGASEKPAAISLRNIGEQVKFAVVHFAPDAFPVRKFGSDELDVNQRTGKPKTGHELTVLVLDAGGAVTGNLDNGYTPVETDTLARIMIDGRMKWDTDGDAETGEFRSWGGALDTLPDGLEHGVIGLWKFVDEKQGSAPSPQKRRRFRLRAPKRPDELDLIQRCEQLAASLQSGAVNDVDDAEDEAPF